MTCLRSGVAGLVLTVLAATGLGCSSVTEVGGSTTGNADAVTAGVGGGGGAGGGTTGPPTAAQCFADHHFPITIDYDQFQPTLGSHCKGTDHQAIEGVEKVVFLGDSITEGTFPTPSSEFYRTVLSGMLGDKFPGVEIAECAENGARMDDLAGQIQQCFPDVEDKRTLVVMTMGGNDIAAWARDDLSLEAAKADADVVAAELRAAVESFYADRDRFPAGVYVVFGNVYEFTDGTAELDSCPGANLIGLSGEYLEGAGAVAYLEEQMMKVAVDTGTDLVFMLEEFCGHGYKRDQPGTCFRGDDAELWFDLTCIHPNPTGHHALADLFANVID